MAYHLIRRQTQEGAELSAAGAVLSIRLRPDGFSFAAARPEDRTVADLAFDAGHYPENLQQALHETVPEGDYASIRVSLPTARFALIPSVCDRSELPMFLLTEADARTEIPVSVRCGDKTLRMAAPADPDAFFRTTYGDRFEWQHPLAVSLGYDDTASVLRIDTTADRWFACLTLRGQLAAAEAFPLENEASLLLGVNRLTVIHKAGALRIVCSGAHCEQHAAALAACYADVSVDPDGADRDLIRLWR
jgi:hypothetical protein